jgi:hypothetical protein
LFFAVIKVNDYASIARQCKVARNKSAKDSMKKKSAKDSVKNKKEIVLFFLRTHSTTGCNLPIDMAAISQTKN